MSFRIVAIGLCVKSVHFGYLLICIQFEVASLHNSFYSLSFFTLLETKSLGMNDSVSVLLNQRHFILDCTSLCHQLWSYYSFHQCDIQGSGRQRNGGLRVCCFRHEGEQRWRKQIISWLPFIGLSYLPLSHSYSMFLYSFILKKIFPVDFIGIVISHGLHHISLEMDLTVYIDMIYI